MLDFAIKHEAELKKAMTKIVFNERYKFYNDGSYYDEIELSKTIGWTNVQMVSLNKNGDILGYIKVALDRDTMGAYSLCIVNLSEDKITFGRDVFKFIDNVLTRPDIRKLNYSVIVGNPIESTYDKLTKKYGGRVVGIQKEHCKLFDGKFYDFKIYEIFSSDYIKHKNNI